MMILMYTGWANDMRENSTEAVEKTQIRIAEASLLIETRNRNSYESGKNQGERNEVKPLDYQIGQVVYSKSGHDKGDVQMICALEGEYLFLVDGKRRKLEKPKRKKKKHIQPTSYVEAEVAEKLQQKCYLPDAEIAKALKKYQKKQEVND